MHFVQTVGRLPGDRQHLMAIQGYIIHVHIVHSLYDLYFMREVNVLHPSLHITVILN